MFLKFYQFLGDYASWGATQWFILLALVVVGSMLARFSPTSLRYTLAPLVALELFLLTPFFACKGSAYMFDRVAGTNAACSNSDYANYAFSNFGLGHWYIVLTYAIVLVFMTYNFWRAFAHNMGWQGYVTVGQRKSMADQTATEKISLDRIRQMESIRRIGK